MTVEIVELHDLAEALAKLTSLSQKFPGTEFVFRGQKDCQWRLCTSYDRYWAGRLPPDELFVGENECSRWLSFGRASRSLGWGSLPLGVTTSWLGSNMLGIMGFQLPCWTSPGRPSAHCSSRFRWSPRGAGFTSERSGVCSES